MDVINTHYNTTLEKGQNNKLHYIFFHGMIKVLKFTQTVSLRTFLLNYFQICQMVAEEKSFEVCFFSFWLPWHPEFSIKHNQFNKSKKGHTRNFLVKLDWNRSICLRWDVILMPWWTDTGCWRVSGPNSSCESHDPVCSGPINTKFSPFLNSNLVLHTQFHSHSH